MSIYILLKIFTTIFGLLIGSFLNVVIYRVPLGRSVVTPRSSCTDCGHMITWYENIPLISYFFVLKGNCRGCKKKISFRYPLVELLVGIIAYALAPVSFELTQIINFIFYFSVACVFLAHFIIDIEHQLLPDKINIFLLSVTLPYVALNTPITYWLAGSVLGFFSTYGITYLFYKLRGQIGLGGGDIKLFGILGLILGPLGIMNNIFFSCILGSIIGGILILTKKIGRETPFAFGPFILIAATLQIFFPRIFDLLSPL